LSPLLSASPVCWNLISKHNHEILQRKTDIYTINEIWGSHSSWTFRLQASMMWHCAVW
jgi:hypothetical protein